jgi:DNA topoisomerase-3
MTDEAIADGFRNLKDGAAYYNLDQSALCRQQADWVVGMNMSRLFSIIYDAPLRVGRVQTPTLAMMVERESKIASFVKEPFYKVEITDGKFAAEREKLKDKHTAEAIRSEVDGKTATVKAVQRTEKSAAAPKLYDLTTLQREANRLFGYTAAQTLSCVQNLYEQRVFSYPRTDSRYLTEDMAAGLPGLIRAAAGILPFTVSIGAVNASQVISNDKVTDHHAIIPTQEVLRAIYQHCPPPSEISSIW